MIKLNDILNKINSLENDIEDIENIVSVSFYTDHSGNISSNTHEYFYFESLKDLEQFMKLDNEYIIRHRNEYPI